MDDGKRHVGERPPGAQSRPAVKRRRLAGLTCCWLKTMDLYVARVFWGAFLACAASFIGLFVVIEAFAKLDRFLKQEGSLLPTLFRYHLAMVPTVFVNYMGPILTSAAAMITVTLLNRHNELTPLKAAGASIYRIAAPIFAFAVLLTLFTFYLQEEVIPHFREPIRTALALSHGRALNPDPYYDAENGLWIKVREYSTTRQIARGVEITERHPNGNAKLRIDAVQMEWQGPDPDGGLRSGPSVTPIGLGRAEAAATGIEEPTDGCWILHDGSVQRWDQNGNLVVDETAENFDRLKKVFTRRPLVTNMRPVDLETSDLDISYLSWRQLKTQFQRQSYHRHLAVKLHHHFAFPLAHIFLLLLCLPFAVKFPNRSLVLGLAVSFATGAAFFLVSSICASIATDSEYFSPILAAWLPVMLFGSIGITLFDNMPT